MAEQLERSLAQLAEAIKAKAKATTPPASQQIQDPKRPTTSGVVASKTFEYRDGRLAGFVETSGDGARTRQVFERDKAGRITKIVTLKAGEMTAVEKAEKVRADNELILRRVWKYRAHLTAKGMSWFDIARALR